MLLFVFFSFFFFTDDECTEANVFRTIVQLFFFLVFIKLAVSSRAHHSKHVTNDKTTLNSFPRGVVWQRFFFFF